MCVFKFKAVILICFSLFYVAIFPCFENEEEKRTLSNFFLERFERLDRFEEPYGRRVLSALLPLTHTNQQLHVRPSTQ